MFECCLAKTETKATKYFISCTVYMCVNALGAALKHVGDKVFISDSGMRRTVPKVLVVVTDGRSQDDVKKSASKLQHAGNTNPNDHAWPQSLYATFNCVFWGEMRPGQVLDRF